MLKWVIGLAAAALLYRGIVKGDEEVPAPTRVSWKDAQGNPQQRDFEKLSVATDFANAMVRAGAQSVQVAAIA